MKAVRDPAEVLAERCGTLRAAWDAWGVTLGNVDDGQWHAPTRVGEWDLAALVAHHALFPRGLSLLIERRTDHSPDVSSAGELLRRFNQPGGAATTKASAVAARATEAAAGRTPDELRRCFTSDAPVAIASALAAGPIVIDYFGNGTIALVEALRIVTLEATVHLLDVQSALGRAPSVPAAALHDTATLLAEVAEPVAFIDAATGRGATSPFPVIR